MDGKSHPVMGGHIALLGSWLKPSVCPLLVQVTNMARQMVINYGFSDIGPWSLLDQNAQSGDMIMRMMARSSVSENLQYKIDMAVRKIADEGYATALGHIRNNREVWPFPPSRISSPSTLSFGGTCGQPCALHTGSSRHAAYLNRVGRTYSCPTGTKHAHCRRSVVR